MPEVISWDDIFARPCALEIKTLKAGTLHSRLSTLLNLSRPELAGIEDGPVIMPALAHLLRHPEFGSLLIDTGLDSSFLRPGGSFSGLLKAKYFASRYTVEKGEGVDEQLAALGVTLSALYITHAHEHVAGVGALPDSILRMCGAGERDSGRFPLVYSNFLKRYPFRTFDFTQACDATVFGRALDIYGDGSLWALPTPGHTAGHVSYLANAAAGPALFTGDACICKKGFEMGVEPGKAENGELARESFLRFKEFAETYPKVKVVFGHESEEYKIQY